MTPTDTPMFLACLDCGAVSLVVRSAGLDAEAADEYDAFTADHAAHRTRFLYRQGTEACADRPLWDPMATITFEATDGEVAYVVTATRQSIDDPRAYAFARGRLVVSEQEVLFDTNYLRRALDSHFYPQALRPTKLDRFLSVVRDVVSHIDSEELEIAYDAADDPDVSIARLPDDRFSELVSRCAEIFDPSEFRRVVSFLTDNRAEDGLLALRVRRHLTPLT
jgi:hypothetical protein